MSPVKLVLALAVLLVRAPAFAQPGIGSVALSQDAAFHHIINAMVTQSIPVASAIKDAGLIKTGKIMTPNIDRNSIGTALGCGFARGAGSPPSLDCVDFVSEYQVLVQPETPSTSRVTISATVMAVNSRVFQSA